MSNYTKSVDFAAKDALLAGNPAKLGKGTEVDTEFNNIAVAIATKVDSGGALGTPSSGTLTNCTGLPATAAVNTPAGNIAATTVQAAINELDAEKAALAGSASQAFSVESLVAGAGAAATPSLTTTGDTNTGIWFPAADTIALGTGGAERLRLDNAGNIGVGVTPSARLHVAVAQGSPITIESGVRVYEATDNYGLNWGGNSTYGYVQGIRGAGTTLGYNDIVLQPNGGNTLHGNASGLLGYGTGAGGTVTQATNKTTAVTLNKPVGQIITNNAALAGNTAVEFILNNSLVTSSDNIILTIAGGVVSAGSYIVNTRSIGTGAIAISVRNLTAGSLSEAVVINFAIIKGVIV